MRSEAPDTEQGHVEVPAHGLARTYSATMRVFDTSYDYKTDRPRKTKPDADRDSERLRQDHGLLWTKELNSQVVFAPTPPARRSDGYLIFTDGSGDRHWYGSDAITTSYTTWTRKPAMVKAIAGLTEEQKLRYLNPPYTAGSIMIWPVRSKDPDTMNRVRGRHPRIGDRMDLTLECIRRHYAGEPEGPLENAIRSYADFFALYDGFQEFVEFFHFQDLVTEDFAQVRFFLPLEDFQRPGTPTTTAEYVTCREKSLELVERRARRMAAWVRKHHPGVDVRP